MTSLKEVIKYKINFLPKGIEPFYVIQGCVANRRLSACTYGLYETKNTIFSNDSLSLMEDITPLFIYFRATINIIEKMVTEKSII